MGWKNVKEHYRIDNMIHAMIPAAIINVLCAIAWAYSGNASMAVLSMVVAWGCVWAWRMLR